MTTLMKERYRERAAKVPTRKLPDWLVKMIALINVDARLAVLPSGRGPPSTPGAPRRCSAGYCSRQGRPSRMLWTACSSTALHTENL